MKIVTLTMVSLKIAKYVSMLKEVTAPAMVILVDLLLLTEFMLVPPGSSCLKICSSH